MIETKEEIEIAKFAAAKYTKHADPKNKKGRETDYFQGYMAGIRWHKDQKDMEASWLRSVIRQALTVFSYKSTTDQFKVNDARHILESVKGIKNES